MNARRLLLKLLGLVFMVVGAVLAVVFAASVAPSADPRVWFTAEYYSQFLPLAISVMLFICGIFVLLEHRKANFNLAVFGHTASEEALFHWLGWTNSALSKWGLWCFFALSLIALIIAYSNILGKQRLSVGEALFGIVFGAALVLLPNYL